MDVLKEIEGNLKQVLKMAIVDAGLAEESEIPEITLEKPKEKTHGDFAANIAMQMAKIARKAPRQIAEALVAEVDKPAHNIEVIEIAGPGFINIFMKDTYLNQTVSTILAQGAEYGESQIGQGQSVQVEFVSVNPTGDLHLGHARGAAFGDVLCNVYEKAGYRVEREYYINDAGNQINILAKSIETRYMQALGWDVDMPEDAYFGKDIIEIGQNLKEAYASKWADTSQGERLKFFREYGLDYELGKIKKDLLEFGVQFDQWFSESSLYDNHEVKDTLAFLKEHDYTYEKEGATWFKSTEFGDDKDRVLIKKDKTYTYLTPDIAYHKNKLDRGFDKIINVWGADHHGYIPRMKAAIQALGYSKDKLDVLIIQMVNVLEDGEIIKMSKRTGKAVALRELMEDVGVDAVRYFFIMRSNDAQLDFDLELARSESNENPVYYVQYAHARICTMLKQAKEKGFTIDDGFDEALLVSDKEKDLLKALAALPKTIQEAAERQAPYKMTQYVFDLAGLLHKFYNSEKVIDEDNPELSKARIALMQAVRITIQNSLAIIGVSAPEKM